MKEKKKRGRPLKLTVDQVIKAIRETKGLKSIAARHLGVDPATILNYERRYPNVRQAIKDEKEALLDFAESKLYKRIDDGDTIALLFFLKTQGKSRGYIERVDSRQEHVGEDGGPIRIVKLPSKFKNAEEWEKEFSRVE